MTTLQQPPPDLSRLTLDQLIDEDLRYAALLDQAEAARAQYRTAILDRLQATGLQVGQAYIRKDGVSCLIQIRQGSKTISREKLVLSGVDADVIDRATVQAPPSKPFITTRLPKAEKDVHVLGEGGSAILPAAVRALMKGRR